tara:strand:+ start:76 stop:963 length:888 start_codon:yes stop_codon:yes gene_type:complete
MKKKYYRNIESIIKRFLYISKNTKNKNLQEAISSAIYRVFNNKNGYLLKNNKYENLILYTNETISKEIFIKGNFEFDKLLKTKKILGHSRKKLTLVDIGANIGSISIPALTRNYFTNAIVFEPEIRNYRILQANIYLNKLENRIQSNNVAISSSKSKKLKLFKNEFNRGDNRISNKKNYLNRKMQIVNTDILDNYTKKLNKKNSLIWMDTQGHECFIIQGAKKTLKKRIPLVMEFQPDLMPKNWINKFNNLFKNYNYFYNLSETKNVKQELNTETIKKLYKKIEKNKSFTDLLLI